MLPDNSSIVFVMLLAVTMNVGSLLLPKKTGIVVEVIVAAAVLVWLLIRYPAGQAAMLMAFGTHAYAVFGELMDRDKWEKREDLNQKLREVQAVEIGQRKDVRRIAADFALTCLVCLGAALFYLFAPEHYAVLRVLIVFMFTSVLAHTIERIGNVYTTRLFWLPEEHRLVILSRFQPRNFPLHDLKEVTIESSPDLLKLHPLFTFMSSHQDYTSSFGHALKLSFPGENIYLTPDDGEKWKDLFDAFARHGTGKKEKNVLPLWHPTVWKRLFWKGYFASTVKGISAYTGLLAILIWLDAPAWATVMFVVLWWLLNMYVSDRVLIAATDAEPLTEGEIYERAQRIFQKAGIPLTRLFAVDSPIYNGMATGMNIGRAVIMLTTATLQLPTKTVEAILAHEAAHIRKRDVLTHQLARLVFFCLLAGFVYLFFEQLRSLAQNYASAMILIVYALMAAFPLYLSFVTQWTEVRADYFGASLLSGGNQQMAEGLADLAIAQERDLEKTYEHQLADDRTPLKSSSGLERDSWFWRFVEFQFQTHPPMYWRIHSLTHCRNWREARKHWVKDRFMESLPDCLRKRRKGSVKQDDGDSEHRV